MVDEVITKQELIDAQKDAKTLEDVINGAADTQVTTRLGRTFWTLATLNSKLNSVETAATQAIASMNLKVVEVEVAKVNSISAMNSKVASVEAARVAAQSQMNAKVASVEQIFDGKLSEWDGEAQTAINDWQDALNTITLDDGVPALAVSDLSGKSQQEINNNTAYFYHTVSEMVADENIVDGVIVGTKGYHNIFDDGGAIYLISSTATNYSIPLANGLYAVFRDTFDIRKFGIVSSATLDQSENIRRMIAYADSRVYEIDFHNFDILSPNIPQFRTLGKANLNCMGFNYLHDIQNLRIYNNKTTQLKPGKCLLGFYPKSNMLGTFKLTNVKLDAWVDDYSLIDPNTGTQVSEGDGSMHGFSTFPHPEWVDYYDYAESFSEISFELDGVEFLSNAVSYNIELARIPAKKVTLKNVRGDYLALMVHHYAKDLIADGVHGVYRDDRKAGRVLVTNLLHCEPAMVSGKSININQHSLSNISSTENGTGAPYRAYFYQTMGVSTNIKKLSLDNVIGLVATNSTTGVNYPFRIDEFSISNSSSASIAGEYSAGSVFIRSCTLSSNTIPSRKSWDYFEATNSTLRILFFDPSGTDFAEQGDFNFLNCKITDTHGIGHSGNSNRWFNSIKLVDCTTKAKIAETGFAKLTVIGGEVFTNAASTADVIIPTKVATGDTRPSEVYIEGVRSTKPQLASTFFVKGTFAPDRPINLLAVNNVLVSKLNWAGANVSAKSIGNVFADSVTSVVYDPPSLAPVGTEGDAVTTTVTVPGAAVGDFVQVTFNRYNPDVRIYAVVSAANTVTAEFRNISTAPINLASGTLTVKIV